MNFLVLAAGQSQRMGQSKMTMNFLGQPWWQHQVQILKSCGFQEICFVANEDIPVAHVPGGQSPFESLQKGLRSIQHKDLPCFMSPIDVPWHTKTLKTLIDDYNRQPVEALIPRYKDRNGHPVLLSPLLQRQILESPSDFRLDFMLREFPENKKRILALEDPFITMNINTPEDLQNLLSYYKV